MLIKALRSRTLAITVQKKLKQHGLETIQVFMNKIKYVILQTRNNLRSVSETPNSGFNHS